LEVDNGRSGTGQAEKAPDAVFGETRTIAAGSRTSRGSQDASVHDPAEGSHGGDLHLAAGTNQAGPRQQGHRGHCDPRGRCRPGAATGLDADGGGTSRAAHQGHIDPAPGLSSAAAGTVAPPGTPVRQPDPASGLVGPEPATPGRYHDGLGGTIVPTGPGDSHRHGTGPVRYAGDGKSQDQRRRVSARDIARIRGARIPAGEVATVLRLLRGQERAPGNRPYSPQKPGRIGSGEQSDPGLPPVQSGQGESARGSLFGR